MSNSAATKSPEALPRNAIGDPSARLVRLSVMGGPEVVVWLLPEDFHTWGRVPGRTYTHGAAKWFVTLTGELRTLQN